MNLELDLPGWVRTDMTMNDILIRTGTVNRAETDEPDAVNEAATWRARCEQAERRIAELEAERVRLQLALYQSRDRLDTARRSAAARLRAVKRMKRVARHYQLLALRLAVGAELSGVAEAAQRAVAANEAAGRKE